ncbi:MAG TPA: ATP-binding cassette domain-containing protein [Actinomycetota bacterium]|jgi:zinc transport system ATP-binding protein|nr:ATP-binding cassette domain-containing protein [Actinomycetota bacterium]
MSAEPAGSHPQPRVPGGILVRAESLSFAYGPEPVLLDVGLEVRSGEFVALVGPNGSGKSTLLKLLLGTLEPGAGRVELLGRTPRDVDDRWRVGYVPQRPSLMSEVPATVEEIVAAGRLRRRGWWRGMTSGDRDAVGHAIDSVGLGSLATKPLHELSIGQQQRAFIARAFAGEPELLVLDEPIAGVDAESQRRFRDSLVHLIRHHGAGVLLVSHELAAVADVIDRVVVLKRRVVFDGTPAELAERGVSLGIHRDDLPLWLEDLR